MRSRLRFAVITALGLLPGCAPLGTIRGTLRLPDSPGQVVLDSQQPDPLAHWPVSEAVIYLERAPVGMWWGPPAPIWVPMQQDEHRFSPRVLAVVSGTVVRFVNKDRVYHSLFSIAPARRFDTGPVPPGGMRNIRFDRPGAVAVFCELDADMAGYVFVAPNACFTRPAADGSFRLPPLPVGRYVLRVWHPTVGTTSRVVELNGEEARLVLRLPSSMPAAVAP